MHIQSQEALISLDRAGGGGDVSFISHAHNDHIVGVKNKTRIMASDETIALGNLLGQNTKLQNTKLLNAGHILGSRQLVVENKGEKILYTGDIRTRSSILFKGAEIVECDFLIIESTYGNPQYKFPDYCEIYSDIEKWVNKNSQCNLLIGGYALGKSQELIKILNSFGIVPIVDKNIEHFNCIYEKFGVKLERAVVGTEEAEQLMTKPFVGIVEMKKAKRYFANKLAQAFGRKTLVAVATGWALSRFFDTDISFLLSDHADFYDLLEFIKSTNAKRIEFVHGDGTYLKKHLKIF
ncbi:MAG: MBL fold metallo-hydrolase [Candidatus Micrarchaeota archaeon]